jgi:hypothetical protein
MNNKFLSLEWFKSKVETSIDKVIASKIDSLIQEESEKKEGRLYFSMKMVNKNLTVVLNDGAIISKPNACEDDFHAVANATSIEEILAIVSSPEVMADVEKVKVEAARIKALQKGIQLLGVLSDFTVEGQSVYLAGTSRTMPQLLVEKFIEVVDRVGQTFVDEKTFEEHLNDDEEYMALKNFFMWCCLNPRAEVAHELYRFLTENSFRITKQGFIVALRNIVTLHGSPKLVHFVSNTYNKVKAVWKKNPNEYTVFLENGEYKLVHDDKLFKEETFTSTTCPECEGEGQFYDKWDEEWTEECENCDGTGEVEEYEYTITVPVNHGEKIGNLVELYLDLPNREENRFTDDWTKSFDIRIGQVTSMPKEECNWSTQDCAAAGLKYVASL